MRRSKTIGDYIRTIIIIILIGVFCVSAFMIAKELLGLKKDADTFDTLSEEIESDYDSETDGASDNKDIRKRNLKPLFKKNKDFIGWICIPNTHIDYPVMHTPDDPEKYLHRNFYGEYSVSGTPFMDYRCSVTGSNLVFFAHNMKNDTMFSDLLKYTDKKYYKRHPFVEFETLESGCIEYKIFAVLQIKSYDAWYDFIGIYDEEEFNAAVQDVIDRSVYDTGIVPRYGEKLLTLSTCYTSNSDERMIIIAVDRIE